MGVLLNVQVYRGGQLVGSQQFDSEANRTIKIGRLASAQVKLDDPKVSRIHAVIEFAGNDMSLIDMGSTEGTAVNGAKVHKVKLNNGDQVLIGDTTLVVTTGAAAAAQAQAPAAQAPAPATVGASAPSFPGAPPRPQVSAGAPAAGWAPGSLSATATAAPPSAFASAAATSVTAPSPFSAAPTVVTQPPVAQAPVQPRFDPGSVTEANTPIKRITQQRLRAAAVESKPHPALAPEQPMTSDNRLLEMRLYWGEVLLGINHYHRPRKITMGETKRTNVFISSEGLPVEEFPFVRYIDDDYVLTFTNSMEGEIELGGQMQSLQSVKASSLAKRDEDFADSYSLKLPMDARLILHHGGATFAMRFVPPSEGVPKSLFKDVDWQAMNFMVMSTFFHVALIVTLLVYPYDTESLRDDLFDKPDRFAALILDPPKPNEQTKNMLEKIEKKIEKKKEEIVEKEKPKEKVPEKQLANVKVPVTVKPQKTQAQKSEEVKQKFSKLFSGSGAGAGSLLGGGGGGSLSGTLANVIGTAGAGSASAGMAGMGIRGTGPITGGGVGTSRGIAGIGTSGRLGGGGLNYGAGVGLGKGKDRGVLDIGTPLVMGSLDPAVIKKVIDENKAQIRYCYERELQRNQGLEGKIQMRWVISATGSVSTVKVRDSTMNNANVENCIAEKIKTWRFPAPAGGGIVEVNYPFIFKAN